MNVKLECTFECDCGQECILHGDVMSGDKVTCPDCGRTHVVNGVTRLNRRTGDSREFVAENFSRH